MKNVSSVLEYLTVTCRRVFVWIFVLVMLVLRFPFAVFQPQQSASTLLLQADDVCGLLRIYFFRWKSWGTCCSLTVTRLF